MIHFMLFSLFVFVTSFGSNKLLIGAMEIESLSDPYYFHFFYN